MDAPTSKGKKAKKVKKGRISYSTKETPVAKGVPMKAANGGVTKKGASQPQPKQAIAKSGGSEFEEHKAQLEALKEKDPEFYNYLKQADKELLAFGTDSVDDSGEEDGAEVSQACLY